MLETHIGLRVSQLAYFHLVVSYVLLIHLLRPQVPTRHLVGTLQTRFLILEITEKITQGHQVKVQRHQVKVQHQIIQLWWKDRS